MFLTKECDYALRVVRELADGKMKTVSAICEREKVPVPFAYKIIKKLRKAGIVASHRGASGGYRLNKPADRITIFEIVSAVDEGLFIIDCLKGNARCACNPDMDSCGMRRELSRIQKCLTKALSQRTMAEIV